MKQCPTTNFRKIPNFTTYNYIMCIYIYTTQKRTRLQPESLSEFTRWNAWATVSEGLSIGSYVAVWAWMKPATLRTQGGDYPTVPPHLINCGWRTCLMSLRGRWDSNLQPFGYFLSSGFYLLLHKIFAVLNSSISTIVCIVVFGVCIIYSNLLHHAYCVYRNAYKLCVVSFNNNPYRI
jgi:hypothetical protein